MARLRYNGLATGASGSTVGLSLGASLTSGATSVTFNAALTHSNGTAVPTITGSDYIPLEILDANGRLSEVVYLTAYTAAATTGTITRGQEGTTGVAHSSGDKIVHGATVIDIAFSGASVQWSTLQNLSTGWNFLPGWDAESFDTDGYHDNVTNNTRLTVPTTGYYLLTAHFDGSATSTQLSIAFVLNTNTAATAIPGLRGDTGNAYGCQISGVTFLTAGDYVRVSSFLTNTIPTANCTATITRLG